MAGSDVAGNWVSESLTLVHDRLSDSARGESVNARSQLVKTVIEGTKTVLLQYYSDMRRHATDSCERFDQV